MRPEQLDQSGGDICRRSRRFARMDLVRSETRHDLLGGITTLKFSGLAAEKSNVEDPLYQPLSRRSIPTRKRNVTITLIPFYTVGNREPSPMEVWLPIARPEPETRFGRIVPTASERRSEATAVNF